MCPCCGVKTSRFNTDCHECFEALLEGRVCHEREDSES